MREEQIQQALVLWSFQREVNRQCDFALKAFRELDAAVGSYKEILGRLPYETVHEEGVVEGSEEYYLRKLKDHKEEQDAKQIIEERGTAIWFCLQNILVSVANLSKLLWSGQNASNFSQSVKLELRTSLDVREDSPLKSRKFRNHFEHFDERLETWATSPAWNLFIDSVILTGNPRLFDPELVNPRIVFRHYDPQNKILTFQGKSYHLQPVLAAVQTLGEKATAKVAENPLLRVGSQEL